MRPRSNAMTIGLPTSQNNSGGIGGPAIAKVKIRIMRHYKAASVGGPFLNPSTWT